MDPITQTCREYSHYLRGGGAPIALPPSEPHQPARTLSPSSILLCDRKAVYSTMRDVGEIEEDIRLPPEMELDFRVGLMFEDFIAQAIKWKGALVEYQTRLTNGVWKGRLDLVVDPAALDGHADDKLWVVEVKTIKSNNTAVLSTKFPKDYHIAQVAQYVNLKSQPGDYVPCLYYALRSTFNARLYSLAWDEDGDFSAEEWGTDGFTYHSTLRNLQSHIHASMTAQEAWLLLGAELPDRCGATPDAHPFLCVDKDWRSKTATPSCQYFGRCWETNCFLPFPFGAWGDAGFDW